MVSGAGPGLGKSTLVTGLVSALRAAGEPVEHFAEEDILSRPEFAVVAGTFVRDGIVPPERLLTDALFPFSTSLFVWGHREPAIARFLRTLAAPLPASAILIYLDAMSGRLWKAWPGNAGRRRWWARLVGLFTAEREATLRALRAADWPVVVVAGSADEVLGRVLGILSRGVSRGGGR